MVRPRKLSRKEGLKAAELTRKVSVQVDKVAKDLPAKGGQSSSGQSAKKSCEPPGKKRIVTKAQRKHYSPSPSPQVSESEADTDILDEEAGEEAESVNPPTQPDADQFQEPPERPPGPPSPPEPTEEPVPGPSMEPPKSKKKAHHHLQTYSFTEELEAELAEWYESQPIFYNRKSREYKDVQRKQRLVEEKAAMLDPPATCKYKFSLYKLQ